MLNKALFFEKQTKAHHADYHHISAYTMATI